MVFIDDLRRLFDEASLAAASSPRIGETAEPMRESRSRATLPSIRNE
jgi:hypothetical protein